MSIGNSQSLALTSVPLTKLENYINSVVAPWTPQYDPQTGQAIAGTGGMAGVVKALTGKNATGTGSTPSFFGIDMVDIVLVAVGLIIIVTAALKLLGDSSGTPEPIQSIARGAKRVHAFGVSK